MIIVILFGYTVISVGIILYIVLHHSVLFSILFGIIILCCSVYPLVLLTWTARYTVGPALSILLFSVFLYISFLVFFRIINQLYIFLYLLFSDFSLLFSLLHKLSFSLLRNKSMMILKQSLLSTRILWYLKGTPDVGIFLPHNSTVQLKAFYDSDWATCSQLFLVVLLRLNMIRSPALCVNFSGSLISFMIYTFHIYIYISCSYLLWQSICNTNCL